MGDDEEETTIAAAQVEEEEVTDLMTAVRKVLKNALVVDGVIRDAWWSPSTSTRAKLRWSSWPSLATRRRTRSWCKEPVPREERAPHRRARQQVPGGEWAGLCRIDKDGLPRKVVGASCVCVTEYGEEGNGYEYMTNYLAK
ncbi:unnamed protein product [Prorocentrum cordatum]|uniref:Uncharacterized protein n=1 Tax=Prorocentrum cordatum TaxID=2364126 RepID=A0ABN9TQR8_9DINO|nr:unnamed protein product [Polarella glacialis]